ncbi:MAG: DUF535 family protein [Terracidiphilus sp.]
MWRGLTHIGTHRRVLRDLLRFPILTELVFSHPSFAVKYLTPDYLARGLSVGERASCFVHHYRRLQALLPEELFVQALQDDVTIHEIKEDGNRFAITMGLSRPNVAEGELSLQLKVNDETVYVLSFTIVPGSIVGSRAAEVLFITRLQGVKGRYSLISMATRTLHDVSPPAMLLAALQGVAGAFGISEIGAIAGVRQSSYGRDCLISFNEAYDDFFTGLGMTKREGGIYYASLPFQLKPLASIKQGHKLRTKKKRTFKLEIERCCARFLEESVRAALPDCGWRE